MVLEYEQVRKVVMELMTEYDTTYSSNLSRDRI
jgi:hypothetical protein